MDDRALIQVPQPLDVAHVLEPAFADAWSYSQWLLDLTNGEAVLYCLPDRGFVSISIEQGEGEWTGTRTLFVRAVSGRGIIAHVELLDALAREAYCDLILTWPMDEARKRLLLLAGFLPVMNNPGYVARYVELDALPEDLH